MTALLYISYSSKLSEADKLSIDKSVFENRLAVSKFVNKRLVIVISLISVIWFISLESVSGIGLPMPPTSVIRFQPSHQDYSKVKIAKVIPRKKDLIVYNSPKELLFVMYLSDPKLSSNEEILELLKELRGGSWDFIRALAVIGMIILALSMGESFVLNNQKPGWGLDRQNRYQPPSVEHRYPPYYDLFSPKGTCYADRPKGSLILSEVHPQSSREELTQVSTNVVQTQTQVSGFQKNSKVDLHKCFDEVNRRASEIGCTNFECSLERFRALATENGELNTNTAREAITVLNGEMLGYYSNAEREYYGKGVYGPDFKVTGLGEYSHVSHVEVKNPVGYDIERASSKGCSNIVDQGNKIGAKLSKQQSKWSNATFRASLRHCNPNATFPHSPANYLGLVDLFDVPISEKSIIQRAIENNCTNTSNVIFINNKTNI